MSTFQARIRIGAQNLIAMAPTIRFLMDRTSENQVDVFPQSVTTIDAGLAPDAPDETIFNYACEYGMTIVTENDRHFRELMLRAAQRSGKSNCAGDGFGLVVPNHRNDIKFRDLTRRLKYEGRLLTWDEVQTLNLRVSVLERSAELSPMPRCKFCQAAVS